jgi:hypothetical protein
MPHLISSDRTHYFKDTFPRLYFGFLVVFLFISLILLFTASDFSVVFVIMPIILGAFGYFIMKRFVFDLVDEVWDEGDSLLVKNAGREARVALADIINLNDSVATNPPRITLTLRTPNTFGRDITFSPPRKGLFRLGRNPVALALIDRIDAARRGAPVA